MSQVIDLGEKYAVTIHDDCRITASRYGCDWRDCTGDNLVYQLAVQLDEARQRIKELEDAKFRN